MSDLVERLRGMNEYWQHAPLYNEAADRIEQLECHLAISRGKHTRAIEKIERLKRRNGMTNWKCTACDWHGEENEIGKEEVFKETRLEPAEWVWHCPVCHKDETLEEDTAAYCAWCEDEIVSDEGEVCTECRTCYAEQIADEANGH